ncbi:IPExxxVDY family protein [Marivirga sp. S37H4]|uniref:IPExxxVDY family protein n=1 Tax=Marivirga aurantiaca TaxID=2802615 RepID=A0A935C7Z5_9BACT|nr:IPExxxVDY family protein [Marivirga aurantiaca]MBK6264657.1 IPExxxVDY family protein [Marivirga aurantiaca]
MHKNVLKADAPFDFQLLGFSTPLPDFQLAWHINQVLNIHLKRGNDHEIAFKNNQFLRTSNFQYKTEHLCIKLIKNRVEESEDFAYVIPEAKNIDYFLVIQDETKDLEILIVKNTLSKIKNVNLVQKMDLERLKSVDNLIDI